MKSLVIGAGQIGRALHEIFSEYHECHIRDIENLDCPNVQVLHIAYPDCESFISSTRGYIGQYKPRLTVIHSSVSVGTTAKCGDHVVHSPERGRHPNLVFEMKQFPKFVGGFNKEDVFMACKYFERCAWPVVAVDNPCWTEVAKLISNVHLGLEIAWRQEVGRIFKAFGAQSEDMRVYEAWEDSYNKGLRHLGQYQLIRPRLKADPIGGHCILPCLDILSAQVRSGSFEFIRESNERAKAQKENKKRSIAA